MARPDVDRAKNDLGAYSRLVGWPLEPWQLGALELTTRQTCLVSPRQCGKSYSLSVLATWWAYRKPGQLVLVVSAGDEAAGRLLRTMRQIAGHPLLAASVDDETQHRVILSNGSEIRSVPASERQVRGWTVDLLIVDEAAFVSEDLLVSAALPTTAARKDARIVLASTPWGTEGPFYRLAVAGLDPANPVTRSFRWKLADAPWITPEAVQAARDSMSPLRFRAEFEGEWVPAGDAYFDTADILACVADFAMTRDGAGAPATAGLDFGRQRDAHAIALAGLLDDYGANGRPVVIVPWVETSRRPYGAQLAEVEALAGMWALTVLSETNGVGAYPSEQLAQKLLRTRVIPVASTQASKEDCYGRLAALLAQRSIVLPNHPELLRQLGGVSAQPTPSGGLRIAARLESIHDDLPDALALAVGGLPRQLAEVPVREVPEDQQWCETACGVSVPLPVITLRAEASWGAIYGGFVICGTCGAPYPANRDTCPAPGCGEPNPQAAVRQAEPAPAAAAAAQPGEAVPAGNYWNPDLMRCAAGHLFDRRYADQCPACRGGTSGGRMPASAGLPPRSPGRSLSGCQGGKTATRLGDILSRR